MTHMTAKCVSDSYHGSSVINSHEISTSLNLIPIPQELLMMIKAHLQLAMVFVALEELCQA